MDYRKQAIIDALRAFINKRPGFDTSNYGDAASYRSDSRMATRQRDDALRFLRDIELRDSISADDILKETQSGRVSIGVEPANHDGALGEPEGYTVRIDYCAGQYWCTEYRGAVARLCASVLWTWKREKCMPDGVLYHNSETGETGYRYNGQHAGDYLRASFKREYGRTLAGRYFD